MPFPMQTGYQRDEPEMPMQGPPAPPAPPMDPAAEVPAAPVDLGAEAGPAAGSGGGRTGADVIAAALAQPNVCKPAGEGAGTTAPQADMEFGADPGYGA